MVPMTPMKIMTSSSTLEVRLLMQMLSFKAGGTHMTITMSGDYND